MVGAFIIGLIYGFLSAFPLFLQDATHKLASRYINIVIMSGIFVLLAPGDFRQYFAMFYIGVFVMWFFTVLPKLDKLKEIDAG